jgi:hypothetical protein
VSTVILPFFVLPVLTEVKVGPAAVAVCSRGYETGGGDASYMRGGGVEVGVEVGDGLDESVVFPLSPLE